MIQKKRVAVLLGGDSPEREVSFNSGYAMAEALSSERYETTIFDVACSKTPAFSHKKTPESIRIDWKELAVTLCEMQFDAILPALHGGWGEDGTLQGVLEVTGIPYVGSPLMASSIAMDKQVCKTYLSGMGVAVPRGFLVDSLGQFQHQEQKNGWLYETPIIVKPNSGGSSVAVAILKEPDPASLRNALKAVFEDGDRAALVEECIEGIEITCATMGEGKNARALPQIEIVPQSTSTFYDYNAKYLPGGSEHLIPPRISHDTSTLVEKAALKAHRALGCRGVARSDFMVSTDGTPYFLELNTIPGMTATSLVPDAARAAGMSFEKLIETLVEEAISQSTRG